MENVSLEAIMSKAKILFSLALTKTKITCKCVVNSKHGMKYSLYSSWKCAQITT